MDNLPPEHIGYVFDLDGTEVRGQHNEGDKFSVDSHDCGMPHVAISSIDLKFISRQLDSLCQVSRKDPP